MRIKRLLFVSLVLLTLFLLAVPAVAQGAAGIGNTSLKKGISADPYRPDPSPAIMGTLGNSWWFNWTINENALKQSGYEFVSMFHRGDDLNYAASLVRAHPGRYWLVFNEPDYHEQDNIGPAPAAEFYYALRKAIKEADPSAKLIVGGVLWPSGVWMTGFREEYKKRYGAYPTVEGWHVHHYVEPNTYSINDWPRVMEFWKNWMINNGGVVELWLTEFGCLNSDSIGYKIIQDQIGWLESQPWITRYAWFVLYISPDSPFKGSLLSQDGSGKLSALGQLYATFGTSPSTASFTLQATAGSGGTISPAGNISVGSGGNQTFSITPNSGYRITDVKVDGVSVGGISTYTFTNVNAAHQIEASFSSSSAQFSLTVSAGAGGTATPEGVIKVNSGGTQAFAITPNTGYRISDVLVDGVSQGARSSYSFSNVTANHTLNASFVSDGSGSGGGNVVFAVNCGGLAYRDKAGLMYVADTETSGKSYNTTSPIDGTEDDLLYQSERWGNFSYNIPVSNGSYSVTLRFAELYESNAGRRVFSVKIEGKEVVTNLDLFATVGKNKAYDVTVPVTVTDGVLNIEFYSRLGDAKVNAFMVTSPPPPKQFVITATAGPGGAMNPSGATHVTEGGQKAFTIVPDTGYSIADVQVDGASVGALSSYALSNVTANHTIMATFNPLFPTQYSLAVQKGGDGSGTVNQNPSGASFAGGTVVTLTAKADANSVFAGWSGACTGMGTCTVTLNGNKSVTATFNQQDMGVEVGRNSKGVVVDLDGDGREDVVRFDEEQGKVVAWYLNGLRVTKIEGVRDVAEAHWKMAGGGNLRPDGSYNIFWHNEGTGKVYAWFMNRAVYLGDKYIRTVEDTRWRVVGIGDFDGDGNVDILWQHQGTGSVYIWFMNGMDFVRDQYVATVEDVRWQIVGVGDLNGDGKAEILWQHTQGGRLYIWYIEGARLARDQYIRDVEDMDWKVVGTGKFSDDREANILWRHQISGEVYIWHLDGGRYLGDSRVKPVGEN